MSDELTNVKFTVNIPFGRPNANNTIFSKDAIENAVSTATKNIPIVYKGGDNPFDERCVGITTETEPVISWCDETQTAKIEFDGVVFNNGANIVINKMKDDEISDFTIRSIGVTL